QRDGRSYIRICGVRFLDNERSGAPKSVSHLDHVRVWFMITERGGRVVASAGARRTVCACCTLDPTGKDAAAGWWEVSGRRSGGVYRDRVCANQRVHLAAFTTPSFAVMEAYSGTSLSDSCRRGE